MDTKDLLIEKQAAEIKMLKETITRLQEEIARLKKDSSNSSKPPSSDIVKPSKILRRLGKKRKSGGQHGHRKFSRQPFEPEQVDEVIEYELRDKDAKDLKPLDEWLVIQQIELPDKLYKVIEHRARKYIDPVTGKIHIAPMPDEIRKGGLLGADITAAVGFMKGGCHMSYTTIQQLFKELFELDISRGNALQGCTEALDSRCSRPTSSWPNACGMNRRLVLTKPAIMIKASCTGRGVLIRRITACSESMPLAAVECSKKCWAKVFPVLSARTIGGHIANMPACLMCRCSIAWLI